MYFAELQKKAEEILQSLGNKLSAINSPEPLLRPVPPYISDVITAMELLEICTKYWETDIQLWNLG